MHVHLVFQGLELPELVGRAHLAHRGVVDAAREREERAGEQDVVALLRRAAARRAQAAPGAAARPRLRIDLALRAASASMKRYSLHILVNTPVQVPLCFFEFFSNVYLKFWLNDGNL